MRIKQNCNFGVSTPNTPPPNEAAGRTEPSAPQSPQEMQDRAIADMAAQQQLAQAPGRSRRRPPQVATTRVPSEGPLQVESDVVAPRLVSNARRVGGREIDAMVKERSAEFGLSPEGWDGQGSHVRGNGTTRLGNVVRRINEWLPRASRRLTANLRGTHGGDPAMVLALSRREHPSSWTARTGTVDSAHQGGMDNLGRLKSTSYGVEILSRVNRSAPWQDDPRPHDIVEHNGVTNAVTPSRIPARDQLVAFEAYIEWAEHRFEERAHEVFGEGADEMLANLTQDQRRAWIALTFAGPGNSDAGERDDNGRLLVSAHSVMQELQNQGLDLDDILSNESIGRLHRVNNARKIALHSAIIEDTLLAPVANEARRAAS